MSLRGIAKETLKLPPFAPLARLFHRRAFARMRKGNNYLGIYASHAEALAAVPASLRASFDHDEAAAQYRQRTQELSIDDYAALYWVSRLVDDGCRRFFDLGGHIGVAYYAFGRYRPFPADLRWVVSDLPTNMEAGRQWALTHDPAGQLSFAADKQQADGQDALLVFGALQYLDYDFLDWLGTLTRPPAHLIVNRTPMHDTRDFHTLQNMGFACLPYRIHARPDFLAAAARLGYRLVDAWYNEERNCRVPFARSHDVEAYSGFYLQRTGN